MNFHLFFFLHWVKYSGEDILENCKKNYYAMNFKGDRHFLQVTNALSHGRAMTA